MEKLILLCFIAAIIVPSMQTHVHHCSSISAPKPVEMEISGCRSSPCSMKKGSDIFAAIAFKPPHSTKTLRPKLSIKKWGIRMNVGVPSDFQNACEGLVNATCPLNADELVIYEMHMQLSKYMPSVNVEIEFAFIGDNDKPAFCFAADVKIHS